MEAVTRPLPLRENLRALPPAAWILFGGTFINRFGGFVLPFLVIYLTRSGYSMTQAGFAGGAYGAGHLLASLIGGHLADRIGRRNTIALSMFLSAISMVALSQARTFPLVVTLALFAGAATELYRPASQALITDLVPPEQRVIAFAVYRFAVNLGFAAGPATAGFLADYSYDYLFFGDAITSVIFGVIAIFALPHGLRSYDKHERFGAATRVAIRDRALVTFLLATICITAVDFQMGSTFALHVQAQGLSNKTYGALISLNGVLIVLFEIGITNWLQRYRPQPMIALGYLLSGIGFALTGLAHSVPALAATVVIWTLGEMIASPFAAAYVSHLAPDQYRGRYLGLWVLMWSIGMIIGPSGGTWVFSRSPALLWIACGALGVTAAWLALLRPRAATAAASPSDSPQ